MLAAYVEEPNPHRPLDALRIGEVEPAEPPEGWLRVRVRAATINQHDIWALRGSIDLPGPRPVLGTDAAGVTDDGAEVIVHAVLADRVQGSGDETFDPARTVLSDAGHGTLTEEIWVPARNLVAKPATLSWAEAACLPTAWLTAYRMLFTRARAQPGQTVLVQGAGGAVSTAALQLARAAGLRVIVSSRTESKLTRSREVGADATVLFGDRISEPVDVVVDSVGEPTWKTSVAALRSGGTLVTCGASAGFLGVTNVGHVFSRQLTIVGSTMGTRDELVALVDLVQQTSTKPLVDSILPLAEAATQFERLVRGDVFGKLVVEP